MIRCKELNRNFATQKELFAALKSHKREIIEAKKADIKKTDPVIFHLRPTDALKTESTVKEITYGDYIYPVINTINWLDSHKDVHIWGIWDKSAKEQSGQTYYLVNHDLSIGQVISYPKEVEVMVKTMSWAQLGYDYPGDTQALIFKARLTEKSNQAAYQAIKAGEALQNSVRMQYVSLDLAVNATDEDFKEEKRVWDKYSPYVVNRDALKDGYFWAVKEAKIFKEGSAVLFGSNEATPIMTEEPKQHITAAPSHSQSAAKSTGNLKQLNSILKQMKSLK